MPEVFTQATQFHQAFLSPPIIHEYERVAERSEHDFYRDDFREIIKEIKRVSIMAEPAAVAFQIKDPDDEVYLATATAGNAVLFSRRRIAVR